MSSKSDFIRWWTNYGEMADEEIEFPAFQAGRAFQRSVESAELATLRAQLAEAREGLTEANEIMSVVRHENMQPYRNWVDKYYKHLVNTA